ncbi:uncharacterized protein LOC117791205 [Drosophila innubila]|uniref:uncharacterized protein LOC117791205 n=1 Tax=Drosophila innubila TaxID=198719 RepID=UPI00148C078F|nr:uncharacterized protein LOC117791205 [Drosophila innubila]
MIYRNPCYVLLLLMMCFYEARTLPAVETTIVATGVNTIEESNKLPESNVDPLITATSQEAGNATNLATSGATEAETDPSLSGDNEASASNNEPVSIYAGGLITPEAFQQYLNQYGGAAGLTPLGAAYPAPMTSTPGLYPYPGPIVVQTGYEGFLVPANAAASSESASDVSTTVAAIPAPSASPGMNPLLAFASRLLPTILMSTLFRIAAVVLSAVGVILFGGAITNALCRLTPICDIPSKAVHYLRSGGAQDVGRMLAEEITPERVRRTTEFVRNAIHKYRQLQKLVDPDL